jgi:hypothetical protein
MSARLDAPDSTLADDDVHQDGATAPDATYAALMELKQEVLRENLKLVSEAAGEEADSRKAAGGEAEHAGYLFMCSQHTIAECLERGLMGAEECDWPEVRRVGPNTLLFLHDESRRWLYGVFRASAPPGLGLVPAAWPSDGGRSRVLRWPAQVLVSRVLPAAPPVQLGESLAVALADNPVRDAVISELGEGNLDDALLGKVGASALPPPGGGPCSGDIVVRLLTLLGARRPPARSVFGKEHAAPPAPRPPPGGYEDEAYEKDEEDEEKTATATAAVKVPLVRTSSLEGLEFKEFVPQAARQRRSDMPPAFVPPETCAALPFRATATADSVPSLVSRSLLIPEGGSHVAVVAYIGFGACGASHARMANCVAGKPLFPTSTEAHHQGGGVDGGDGGNSSDSGGGSSSSSSSSSSSAVPGGVLVAHDHALRTLHLLLPLGAPAAGVPVALALERARALLWLFSSRPTAVVLLDGDGIGGSGGGTARIGMQLLRMLRVTASAKQELEEGGGTSRRRRNQEAANEATKQTQKQKQQQQQQQQPLSQPPVVCLLLCVASLSSDGGITSAKLEAQQAALDDQVSMIKHPVPLTPFVHVLTHSYSP